MHAVTYHAGSRSCCRSWNRRVIPRRPFGELAQRVVDTTHPGSEQTTALRKLLEAKDAAVRAAFDAPDG